MSMKIIYRADVVRGLRKIK